MIGDSTRASSILSFALDYAVIYVSLVAMTYLNKTSDTERSSPACCNDHLSFVKCCRFVCFFMSYRILGKL